MLSSAGGGLLKCPCEPQLLKTTPLLCEIHDLWDRRNREGCIFPTKAEFPKLQAQVSRWLAPVVAEPAPEPIRSPPAPAGSVDGPASLAERARVAAPVGGEDLSHYGQGHFGGPVPTKVESHRPVNPVDVSLGHT